MSDKLKRAIKSTAKIDDATAEAIANAVAGALAASPVDAAANAYQVAYAAIENDAQTTDLDDPKLNPPNCLKEHHDFLLAEYNRLCSEIDCYVKENASCAAYSLLVSGVFWSWIASSTLWQDIKPILFIAPAIVAIWFMRSIVLQISMGRIGRYLSKTEAYYYRGAHGWERQVQKKGFWHLGLWGNIFFGLLVLGNLAVAHQFFINGAPEKANAESLRKQTVETAMDRLIKVLDLAPKTNAAGNSAQGNGATSTK